MEGKKSSRIHNPTIRYFQKVLAQSVFVRGDSSGNVNSKELFFIDCVFQSRPIHTAAFMLANMQTIAEAKKGAIVIGGLITSLAPALVKLISGNEYYLMIRSQIVRSILLPNRARIDVRDAGNWLFDLEAPEAPAAYGAEDAH
ncbi:hypothetical protein A2U01_0043884, partial [Trifolium medium]|nr:hypothetical protein [Trifolium medium]